VNVGAGTGNYEPDDRRVVAVEPSEVMLAQRRPDAAPAVRAVGEALPFRDTAFDASMALLSLHHLTDAALGLRELRRVAAHRVVVLTADVDVWARCWLVRDYFPWMEDVDRARMPTIAATVAALRPAAVRVEPMLIPHDCLDAYTPAHWRRPEAYLDPVVRAGISNLVHFGDALDPSFHRLAADLESGAWHRRHADLLDLAELDLGYRIVAGAT
jgi:SAM-dependent methyltransferase